MSVYDKIAKEFSDTRHYKWPLVSDFINRFTLKTEIAKNNILDIGCGNGRNIEYYSSNKNKIIGLDNSIEFVKLCKSKNLEVYFGSMTNLIFSDKEFDFILSIASFHHLNNIIDRKKTLSEIYRVLKPNGIVLMTVWSKNQPSKTKRIFDEYGDTIVPWKSKTNKVYKRYYYIFKLDELINLVEEANFKILEKKWDCGNEILIFQK